MKAAEEERIRVHLEKLRKRERMIDNLEQHAKAASAEDAQDPYKHTTIRDFQCRLEQLGALIAEPNVLKDVDKPVLDTKGLERIISQVKLITQPDVPRVYRPSEGDISFDYVNLSWAHSPGAKDYLIRFWIIRGSSCPEEYACTTKDNHFEVTDLQPSSIVTFQSSSLNRVRYKGEDTSCNVSTKSDNSRSLASPMMSPARFSQALNILGGAQFKTGRHYWEVLIGPEEMLQSANWIIGVSYHSIPRNAWLGAVQGSWVLHHTPKFLKARSAELTKIIELENIHLQRLGILMDCDSGRINFVDVDNNKLIFTFVDKFTQPVLAAMNPGYQGAQLQLRNGFS
ncbi:Oidioi.mRNA.OKI2018_I69.XSR.g16171.t1.cds [Oikopleura dioica]|uniref:Oidioi.mRNA.OKI2018_I69.XSR.g16171.t1.cds n=1 Tax=Oikopleura dioica TaxID=34765 RepID=A0ABN7SKC8_OIKDI|nr:Oidioi.mRNA.OKI2018_I69.XSR.g16171.t1.cds [Oikopleura dioica]